MKNVIAEVAFDLGQDNCKWDVFIGPASSGNTFCFEGSLDGTHWSPVNARRLLGTGLNNYGNIYSNAVNGGPSHYQGIITGLRFVRVVQTLSDGEIIEVNLSTTNPLIMYIIDEEIDIEDAINSA